MQLITATDIRLAHPPDTEHVHALLRAARLPIEGVDDPATTVWVATRDGRVVGAAALEQHGAQGLLRSVVVASSERGRGLGARLAAAVVEEARARGLAELWLLTTTAEGYFPRIGFVAAERSAVPPELGASAELRGACPDTAVVMRRRLP